MREPWEDVYCATCHARQPITGIGRTTVMITPRIFCRAVQVQTACGHKHDQVVLTETALATLRSRFAAKGVIA